MSDFYFYLRPNLESWVGVPLSFKVEGSNDWDSGYVTLAENIEISINVKAVLIMEITDIRVRKINSESKMKAVVSITIDNEFVVHDIKIIEGEKGLFIAMPSKKSTDGEYRDIAHPINSETRDKLQQTILEKYEESLTEEE